MTRHGLLTGTVLTLLGVCVLGCQPDDDPCPRADTSGFVLEIDGQRTGVECVDWSDHGLMSGFSQWATLSGHPERTSLKLTIRDVNPAADPSYFPITLEVPHGAFPWWFELVRSEVDSGGGFRPVASCDEEAVGSTLRIDAISARPQGEDGYYHYFEGFDGEFDVTLENCTFPSMNINGRDVRLAGRWYWSRK